MPILSPNDPLVRDILKTGSKNNALGWLKARAAQIAKKKSCDPSAVERSLVQHIALNAPYAGKEALDTLASWLGPKAFALTGTVEHLGRNPAPLVKRLRARRAPATTRSKRR